MLQVIIGEGFGFEVVSEKFCLIYMYLGGYPQSTLSTCALEGTPAYPSYVFPWRYPRVHSPHGAYPCACRPMQPTSL